MADIPGTVTELEKNGAPHLGRFRPTPASDPVHQGRALYHRIQFSLDAAETSSRGRFEVMGDHLYIEELSGRRAVYVRLGMDSNPYIRIREGMTLRRQFDHLTFRAEDSSTPWASGLGGGRVIALASHGPLVENAEPSAAVDGGFLCYGAGSATTGVEDLFAAAVSGSNRPTVGKGGGVLVVKNTDLGNRLWIRYGDVGLVGAVDNFFFPLEPGESLSIPLRSLVSRPDETVLVGTTAGTCEFSYFASSGGYDLVDSTQERPVTI